MENVTPPENLPISSSPDLNHAITQILCFDPANPDETCPICAGKGVISYQVPIDDPRFGKLFRCPNNPVELDEARQERFRKLSNLSAFENMTFENFHVQRNGYSLEECRSLEEAYSEAWQYAKYPDGWLLLKGTYGCGKTHLAAAVGNARLEQGDMVLFITAPDLLDHLRGSFSPQSETTYNETFERVLNATLLILDDLGVENPSEWAKEKLFQLLNYRYSHRLPTVITTNVEIEILDPRISSRLGDVEFIRRVKIEAPDYRSATISQDDDIFARLSLYRDMHFDNFDTTSKLLPEEISNLDKALQIAQGYAQNPQGWLVLSGSFGSGKTHLAVAIAQHRRDLGSEVIFSTVPDLMDYLRNTFNPGKNTPQFDQRWQMVRTIPLLILDDFSMESATSWAKEKLFQLLDYRYVAKLPTIITTSQPIEDMNERLLSRILDTRLCLILGLSVPSYALRQNRRP